METKQQDLTKVYNEMIALWMGVKNVWVHPKLGVYEAEDETGYIDLVDVGIRSLDYHRDWNKLMPVVDKIGKVKGYQVSIFTGNGNGGCQIQDTNSIANKKVPPSLLIAHADVRPISAVYQSVVEFIKWYEESKNK